MSSRRRAGRIRQSATCWRWDFAGIANSREAQPLRRGDLIASPAVAVRAEANAGSSANSLELSSHTAYFISPARSVIRMQPWRHREFCSEPRLRLGRSIPVMEQRTRVGNRLLAALPPADLDLLVRHFRLVEIERDAVLVSSGDPIERIYFPLSALVAFGMGLPTVQTGATSGSRHAAAV